jgi:hypothetical protein
MSIGALSIGDHPVAGQAAEVAASTNKPPPRRTTTAKSDAIAQPDPR